MNFREVGCTMQKHTLFIVRGKAIQEHIHQVVKLLRMVLYLDSLEHNLDSLLHRTQFKIIRFNISYFWVQQSA